MKLQEKKSITIHKSDWEVINRVAQIKQIRIYEVVSEMVKKLRRKQ